MLYKYTSQRRCILVVLFLMLLYTPVMWKCQYIQGGCGSVVREGRPITGGMGVHLLALELQCSPGAVNGCRSSVWHLSPWVCDPVHVRAWTLTRSTGANLDGLNVEEKFRVFPCHVHDNKSFIHSELWLTWHITFYLSCFTVFYQLMAHLGCKLTDTPESCNILRNCNKRQRNQREPLRSLLISRRHKDKRAADATV